MTKLDDISLAIGALQAETAATRRDMETAREQREQITSQLTDLAQAFDRFVAQQATQHATNQALIAGQTARLDKLQPVVDQVQSERQQLRGAKKLLQYLWVPLAAGTGWVADRAFDFFTRGH